MQPAVAGSPMAVSVFRLAVAGMLMMVIVWEVMIVVPRMATKPSLPGHHHLSSGPKTGRLHPSLRSIMVTRRLRKRFSVIMMKMFSNILKQKENLIANQLNLSSIRNLWSRINQSRPC
jgi:hypothetical protein